MGCISFKVAVYLVIVRRWVPHPEALSWAIKGRGLLRERHLTLGEICEKCIKKLYFSSDLILSRKNHLYKVGGGLRTRQLTFSQN